MMNSRFGGYEVFTRKTYGRKYECPCCGAVFVKAISANTVAKQVVDCQECGRRKTAEKFFEPASSSEE